MRKKTDTLYKVGGRDFPGGPGAKTVLSMQGPSFEPFRALELTCCH